MGSSSHDYHNSKTMSYQPHWNSSNSNNPSDSSPRVLGTMSGKDEDEHRQAEDHEENTSRTSETGALSLGTGSPRAMTPDLYLDSNSSSLFTDDQDLHHLNLNLPPSSSSLYAAPPAAPIPPSLLHHPNHQAGTTQQHSTSRIGTPSTVSTAPSTDDAASLMADYRLEESAAAHHRRAASWGSSEVRMLSSSTWGATAAAGGGQSSWNTVGAQQQAQRVASFRGNEGQQQQQQHFPNNHLQQQAYNSQTGYPIPAAYPNRKTGYAAQSSGVGASNRLMPSTPPRGPSSSSARTSAQPPRQPHSHTKTPTSTNQSSAAGHNSSSGTPPPSNSQQRSASEVLKTLLRKKACLYEPDTSRAVALATWLVGRELALEHGYFSRQQLQSGVHACVASKIEAGIITRTKVNRCMQIILNSCFHYIIPRADGSEEKGDTFRAFFARGARDDKVLLQYLPAPWNDLHVEREEVLQASLEEADEQGTVATSNKGTPPKAAYSTPKNSPKVGPMNADRSPGKDSTDGDQGDSKRAVLLCFNENVRSAEDVFRCHNEFIRDTANASHLQLTAQDWQTFFGRDAASAPYLWGNIGIPVVHADPRGGLQKQADILGQMSPDEANKFRTSWCNKRYEHDHELCGFAHVEVNGGWLRRNPAVHMYKDEMCPYVSHFGDKRVGPVCFELNECPAGIHCTKAHSAEEIMYHPQRYKVKICSNIHGRTGSCPLGDICPNLHPIDSVRHMKKPSDGRHGGRHGRKDHHHHHAAAKNQVSVPTSSPIVYASPAPVSSFEIQLGMPGLQNLYRRNCSVVRSHFRTAGKCKCCYSYFGDDWGITTGDNNIATQKTTRPGPDPIRRV